MMLNKLLTSGSSWYSSQLYLANLKRDVSSLQLQAGGLSVSIQSKNMGFDHVREAVVSGSNITFLFRVQCRFESAHHHFNDG